MMVNQTPTARPATTDTGDTATTSVSEREGRYFDTLIAEQGDFNPFTERGWDTLRRRFVQMVVNPLVARAPQPPFELLDIGCGTGQSLQLYRDHVRRYVGIDLSAGAIEHARRTYPDYEWRCADACALPFADASFDVVVFSSVLHHIPVYEEALAEAYRVLRPGGRVWAFDPNLLHPAMALLRSPRSPLYNPEGVSPNERPLLPSALRRAFGRSGFVGIQQRAQSNIPYRAVAPRRLNALLKAYNRVDYIWERVGLGRTFGTFVVTAGTKGASDTG